MQCGKQMGLNFDTEARMMDGDHDALPPSEPFPKRGRDIDLDYLPSVEGADETSAAHMRLKNRTVKTIHKDVPQELRNSDLAQWNTEYTYNMAIATNLKRNNRILRQAKRNAA